ncbi:hypothetical protein CMUS01_03294 [Colletotrichum musicola]|uniref:Uncharacterized protein n=1 Tax=Colletotrichum musicola TaxID=2175873 RepID=A0A8H6NTR9_9PEZI|nr:hypothetical protein CMUS01_03294 [Colletotrichum musicola]
MDHERSVPNAYAARTNRRASTQFNIDQEGRKPLFTRASRESLGPRDPVQSVSGSNRYGYSPTNARPASRAAAIPRPPSSASPRPPSRAAIPRPSSSLSQTPSIGSNHSAEVGSPGSRIPRPKSIGVFAKGKIPSVADMWEMAAGDDDRLNPIERVRRASPAAIDASPSPAPRPYIHRQVPDEAKVRQTLGKDAVDYSRPRPQSRLSHDNLRDSYVSKYGSPASQQSSSSSGSFTRRLTQYERELEKSPSADRQPETLFGTSRIGPKIAETGQTLARKTSNSSLNGGQSLGRRTSNSSLNGGQSLARRTSYGSLNGSPHTGAVFAKSKVPEGWIKHLLEQDEKGIKRRSMSRLDFEDAANTPLPSIEASNALEPTPPTSRPTSTNPETRSPDKSYAWQLDADFTAGDLQISDSPRIKIGGTAQDKSNQRLSMGAAYPDDAYGLESDSPYKRAAFSGPSPSRTTRSNTRIDEIRQREIEANEQLAETRKNQPRSKNTKLAEIREREAEAEEEMAKMLMARSYYPTPDDLPIHEEAAEEDVVASAKERSKPKNTKLDEIRAREAESLSKRAMASSRLEEIREQNSMFRDLSPEETRIDEPVEETAPARETKGRRHTTADEEKGQHIADTPVTIYRRPSVPKPDRPEEESAESGRKGLASPKSPARPDLAHTRTDSRDLLQRLARATSSSPVAETQPRPQVVEAEKPDDQKRFWEPPAQPTTDSSVPGSQAQPAIVAKAEETKNDDKENASERAGKPFVEDKPRPTIEERFQQHTRERAVKRAPETVEKEEPKKLEEDGQIEKADQKADEDVVVPVKVTEEPVKKPYVPRRRSEDRPRTSDSDRKVDFSRRNRKDDLKPLEPSPDIHDAQPHLKDEPKASDSDRPKSAGLRRECRQRSTDSTKDSRKSVAMSDGDPIDRIEQEMKLFAPADNQSERGSTRPPSAAPSGEDDEDNDLLADETPRPVKVDPLSLPTPKVTGAYVETPATVRVAKVEEEKVKPAIKSETTSSTSFGRTPLSRRSSRASSRARSMSKASESGSEASDQKEPDKASSTTATTCTLRRRNKSVSKQRRPLINSVKPPTVKDDMMELHRIHQIEDSTLDDFEELCNMHLQDAPAPEIESMISEMDNKRAEVEAKPDITKSERDLQLEQIDRMSKTLKDGLYSIRTAKQGIERLEGQMSHTEGRYNEAASTEKTDKVLDRVADKQEEQQAQKSHRHNPDHAHNCPTCISSPASKDGNVSYVHIPAPSIFRPNSYRLSFLGVILLLVSVWYAAESAMCELYCRPTTCTSTPCVWSSTDPTWGVALPVKLDEWTTNGWGRQIANQLTEEASDLWADAHDYMTGTDIATIDISRLDFYGKRQLRRRLRKKGLVKSRAEAPEDKAKWDAWHATRVANERVRNAREMGYDISEENERMGGDEPL